MGFRHPTKAAAIDQIWRERHGYYRAFQASANRRASLDQLPGIGPVTGRTLAARLGLHDASDGRRAA
jgi:transposase